MTDRERDAILARCRELRSAWPLPEEREVWRPQDKVRELWAAMRAIGWAVPEQPELPPYNFAMFIVDTSESRQYRESVYQAFHTAVDMAVRECVKSVKTYSKPHAPKHWRKVFAVDGHAISQDTLKRMIDDGRIRKRPGDSTKLFAIDVRDLPPDYVD